MERQSFTYNLNRIDKANVVNYCVGKLPPCEQLYYNYTGAPVCGKISATRDTFIYTHILFHNIFFSLTIFLECYVRMHFHKLTHKCSLVDGPATKLQEKRRKLLKVLLDNKF